MKIECVSVCVVLMGLFLSGCATPSTIDKPCGSTWHMHKQQYNHRVISVSSSSNGNGSTTTSSSFNSINKDLGGTPCESMYEPAFKESGWIKDVDFSRNFSLRSVN